MFFFFFLKFFDVDHFKSLYWICYNISSALWFGFLAAGTCRVLAPWPGIKPVPPTLEGEVLTTGLPGKLLKKVLNTVLPQWFSPWATHQNCLCFFFSDINIQAAPQANEISISGDGSRHQEFLKLPRWTEWAVRMENHWNVQFLMNNGSFKVYFKLKLLPFSSFGLGGGHGKLLLLILQVCYSLSTCSPKLSTALWLGADAGGEVKAGGLMWLAPVLSDGASSGCGRCSKPIHFRGRDEPLPILQRLPSITSLQFPWFSSILFTWRDSVLALLPWKTVLDKVPLGWHQAGSLSVTLVSSSLCFQRSGHPRHALRHVHEGVWHQPLVFLRLQETKALIGLPEAASSRLEVRGSSALAKSTS